VLRVGASKGHLSGGAIKTTLPATAHLPAGVSVEQFGNVHLHLLCLQSLTKALRVDANREGSHTRNTAEGSTHIHNTTASSLSFTSKATMLPAAVCALQQCKAWQLQHCQSQVQIQQPSYTSIAFRASCSRNGSCENLGVLFAQPYHPQHAGADSMMPIELPPAPSPCLRHTL